MVPVVLIVVVTIVVLLLVASAMVGIIMMLIVAMASATMRCLVDIRNLLNTMQMVKDADEALRNSADNTTSLT